MRKRRRWWTAVSRWTAEIRRRFNPERANVTVVRGCYVSQDGEIISQFSQSPLAMPEDEAEKYLSDFLRAPGGDPMKKECVLPSLVDDLMRTVGLKVEVLSTDAVWFGVTYKEDKAYVAGELKKLHDQGVYPPAL